MADNLYNKFNNAAGGPQAEEIHSVPAEPAPAKEKTRSVPALIMVVALLGVIAVFFVTVVRLNVLPHFYLLALGAVLLIFWLIATILTWNRKRKVATVFGIIWTVLVAAVCIVGTVYAGKAVSTLEQIVRKEEKQETVNIGVFVLKDDPAASVADLAGVPLGRLQTIDREETDAAVRKVGELLHETPVTVRYARPTEILDALLSGQVRAILMDRELILAMETNLEDFTMERIRQLDLIEVAKAAPEAEDPAAPTTAPQDPVDAASRPFILYISGIDDRNGLISHSLSDVNILAAVNPETRQILLVSTPRDYYVQTPVSGEERDKLTHAGLYGVDMSVQTISNLYGLPVDYYFRVDFSGFKAIIDALGGIDVYSDRTFTVEDHTFTEGMNHMTGYQALLFVRQRKTLEGGDRARGIHQMAVINAVLKKAASAELLQNFFPLMNAVAGNFETTVPYATLTTLVQRQLANGGKWTVKTFSVDGTDATDTTFSFPGERYVMLPNEELVAYASGLLQDVLDGKEIEITAP